VAIARLIVTTTRQVPNPWVRCVLRVADRAVNAKRHFSSSRPFASPCVYE
jgi:hypothetical protein